MSKTLPIPIGGPLQAVNSSPQEMKELTQKPDYNEECIYSKQILSAHIFLGGQLYEKQQKQMQNYFIFFKKWNVEQLPNFSKSDFINLTLLNTQT